MGEVEEVSELAIYFLYFSLFKLFRLYRFNIYYRIVEKIEIYYKILLIRYKIQLS